MDLHIAEPQGTFAEAMNYRMRLEAWYARMIIAVRNGEEFSDPRPEPRVHATPTPEAS